jgi:hypothetical protein
MKSYFIDEIEASDIALIDSCLASNGRSNGINKLFWIELPGKFINALQSAHHPECSPYRFAVETGDSWIRAEFFVRTSNSIMCSCNGYCDENLREYIINYIDNMIRELGVRT